MPHVRKCAQCGEPSLKPISREVLVFNSVIHYKCAECRAEIDVTPTSSIGVVTTVGALALLFWGMILFRNNAQPGIISLIIFGLAIWGFGFVTIAPALVNLQNPSLRSEPRADLEVDKQGNNVVGRLIIWIEGFGFLAGFLAPLLVITSVLVVATLVGFVNFTFFGN
jgi:DNA-directed RNA polymerase subunit RPC12/RpoP